MARGFDIPGRDIIRTLRRKTTKTPRVRKFINKLFRRQIMETGIKETKEAIKAICVAGAFTVERLHDGLDLGDGLALGRKLLNKEFRQTMIDGGEYVDRIPGEIKDLSSEELSEISDYFKEECLPEILASITNIQKSRALKETS